MINGTCGKTFGKILKYHAQNLRRDNSDSRDFLFLYLYRSEIASTRFSMAFTWRSEVKSKMAARRYKQKNPVRFYAFTCCAANSSR